MALRHCPTCGCDFPPYTQAKCQICGDTTFVDNEHQLASTWMEDNARVKADRELRTNGGHEEAAKILNWRMTALVKAGYSNVEAISKIAESDADLRRAEDLLKQGCPEYLAVRILL